MVETEMSSRVSLSSDANVAPPLAGGAERVDHITGERKWPLFVTLGAIIGASSALWFVIGALIWYLLT